VREYASVEHWKLERSCGIREAINAKITTKGNEVETLQIVEEKDDADTSIPDIKHRR
jgi:hypothetical protein